MIILKLVPAALLAVVCSASPLLAQTPAPAPAPSPTPAVAPAQAPAAMPAVQTPPPAAAQVPAQPDHSTAISLLDRIQKVLDTALDEQRTKGDTVAIDRGLLDEIRAEVTQVRMSLQGDKK